MPKPTNSSFTDASVTEGGFKIALNTLNDWLGVLIGSVDEYLRIVRGPTSTRPSATESGWLRWNTDESELQMSIGTLWRRLVWSTLSATWHMQLDSSKRYMASFRSFDSVSQTSTIRVENEPSDYVDVERQAGQTVIRCSGTDPIKIIINGVPVFAVDSAGNVIAKGNVTANGSP